MRILLVLSFLTLFTIFPSTDAHSPRHVRSLCDRKAVHHIRRLCPDMCLTGEMLNIYEYCKMGYSDSQVKYICCPE